MASVGDCEVPQRLEKSSELNQSGEVIFFGRWPFWSVSFSISLDSPRLLPASHCALRGSSASDLQHILSPVGRIGRSPCTAIVAAVVVVTARIFLMDPEVQRH